MMKNFRKIFCLVTALTMALSFTACDKKEVQQAPEQNKQQETAKKGTTYPLTVTDSNNKSVTIEKEPAKVVSVAPNITETIYTLGMGNKLVGRTDYCDYPAEVSKVASIGTLKTPNIEKITELKPDIVIASTHFKPEVEKKLEELGIKILVLYGEESFEGVYQTIETTGKILNAQEKAQEIISGMKNKVQSVQDKVKGKNKPVTYYVVSFGKEQYTAGKDTFIGKMLDMAGAKNAADDVTGWNYSLEKLVEKNPEIMICSKYFDSKKGIQAENGYKDLKAVKENKLFEIDNNLLDRQGPRLAEGLEELAKIVHPEAFK